MNEPAGKLEDVLREYMKKEEKGLPQTDRVRTTECPGVLDIFKFLRESDVALKEAKVPNKTTREWVKISESIKTALLEWTKKEKKAVGEQLSAILTDGHGSAVTASPKVDGKDSTDDRTDAPDNKSEHTLEQHVAATDVSGSKDTNPSGMDASQLTARLEELSHVVTELEASLADTQSRTSIRKTIASVGASPTQRLMGKLSTKGRRKTGRVGRMENRGSAIGLRTEQRSCKLLSAHHVTFYNNLIFSTSVSTPGIIGRSASAYASESFPDN